MSDNVRQRITEDAREQNRSEAFIVKAILEYHYKLNDSAPSTIESKPPKKVEQTKQPKDKKEAIKRPINRAEMFRNFRA